MLFCIDYLIVLVGKPAKSSVDANLSVLKEKIQQVRKMERLTLTHTCGWNYKLYYDCKCKKDCIVSRSIEIMGLAFSVIGLVFLIGSLSICLVSLLVHLFIYE